MRINFVILFLALLSCESKQESHPIFDYYPESSVFRDGYVSKYYFHFYPNNPDRSSATEIQYVKYRKIDSNHFKTESYNAGFELVGTSVYSINGDTLKLENGVNIVKTDTTHIDLVSTTVAVWEGLNSIPYQVRYESNDTKYVYTEYQKSVYDSVIINAPAKVFYNEWHYQKEGKDSLFNKGSTKSYYLSNIGFFGSDVKTSTYKRQMELVEQMSIVEFEKRANHGKHRIGYIDPQNTLSDDSNFQICGHERFIKDYYNLDPSAQYKGRKGEMRQLISQQLDVEKLKGQSGMLTFRFVINCKGEAGRFVTNAVDFDFQPVQFSTESVNHLLKILQGLGTWQDLGDTGENDAYTYITFKIEDEKIIDILP